MHTLIDTTGVTFAAKPLTPPLKWAGGKRWLAPRLKELYRPHRSRRLVEPFAGGLAVALGLLPERALLVDINPHAINFYRWLQRGLTIEHLLCNDRDSFNRARLQFNELIASGGAEFREAAELFYYLNRTCYNGLCRFNRKGEFNVPFGRYGAINYTRNFNPYAAVLSRWKFSCADFGEVELQADDFVYADPPYDVEFRQYSRGGFDWPDQVRLAQSLAGHPGPVVASNQATERVLKLYAGLGFNIEVVSAPRMIACNGNRTRANEMIARRNLDI